MSKDVSFLNRRYIIKTAMLSTAECRILQFVSFAQIKKEIKNISKHFFCFLCKKMSKEIENRFFKVSAPI